MCGIIYWIVVDSDQKHYKPRWQTIRLKRSKLFNRWIVSCVIESIFVPENKIIGENFHTQKKPERLYQIKSYIFKFSFIYWRNTRMFLEKWKIMKTKQKTCEQKRQHAIKRTEISSIWYIYFRDDQFLFCHNDINLLISSFSVWWAFNFTRLNFIRQVVKQATYIVLQFTILYSV